MSSAGRCITRSAATATSCCSLMREVGPGAPVGRPNGAVHLRCPVVRRVAAGGDSPACLPAGPREGTIDGIRAGPRVRVRVLPALPATRTSRCSPATTSSTRFRNDYVPTIRRNLDEMPQVGRRHHHRELRVRGLAVGDQLRARPRPRRSGQRVHVQERREGDREAGRLPRHVHDEAVAGLGPAADVTRTSRCCTRTRGERVRGRGRPAGIEGMRAGRSSPAS